MMVLVVVERECGRGSVRWGVPWSCVVVLPVLTARARVGALAAGINGIGPEGMRHLSEGLKANASVQSVTIEGPCTPSECASWRG